jgi:hypothetical protein
VLKQGFEQLHNNGKTPCYLGKDALNRYWLRPDGEEMIQVAYPDKTLPPEETRITIQATYLDGQMFLSI